MKTFENKVTIVTGGNSGIGLATAKLFCEEGAKVVIAGRRKEKNEEVVRDLRSKGYEVFAVQADISRKEDCKAIVKEVIKKYGKIDILINNAGIADKHMPINECTEDWYDKVCKIDQYSVFYMSKYALEHMEKVGRGSIVNISSIGSQGVAGISYSAAKAAVNSMTKNIALYYSGTDIRCNAVAPGPTPTELNSPENMATFHKEFADKCARHLDITLEADVQDQAETVKFLASDAAKGITGQIIYVDKGCSLY